MTKKISKKRHWKGKGPRCRQHPQKVMEEDLHFEEFLRRLAMKIRLSYCKKHLQHTPTLMNKTKEVINQGIDLEDEESASVPPPPPPPVKKEKVESATSRS